MFFTIKAKDKENTLALRMANREEHLQKVFLLKEKGFLIDGGAILNEKKEMVGSIMFFECKDKEELNEYIENEIFYKAGVWGEIEIIPMTRIQWKKD